MAESVSGQFFGERRAAGSQPVSGFRDPRTFVGRHRARRWTEVGRFHVTLGKDSIGFHKTREGAGALAYEHARRVTLSEAALPCSVILAGRGDSLPAE